MKRAVECVAMTLPVQAALLALAACAGGGGAGKVMPPPSFSVGGTVTGLAGTGLVLRDNGGNDLSVKASGNFQFAGTLQSGMAYSVSIFLQPSNPSQTCAVSNGSGTVSSSNITNVTVACATNTYSVGGTVSGLAGGGLVLQDNAADNLAVPADGSFTFATAVPSGMPYSVTVYAQPASPSPHCAVASGTASGTVSSANVTSVVVTCRRFAFVADFAGSSAISAFVVDPVSGVLTAVAGSPFAAGSQPFEVTIHPSGRFAYVVNLGSSNISAYAIDATSGALTPVAGSPFATGATTARPQIVSFDPSGKFAYVAAYLGGNVSAYAVDANSGALTPITGSPFAAGAGPWEVVVDPTGRFAYVNNSASNTISAYGIDASTGALTPIGGSPYPTGATPYVLAFDPSGKFAYVPNQTGNSISAYTVDANTGALTAIAGSPFPTGTNPANLAFDPGGKFVYVGNQGSNDISSFSINATTGVLTPIAGSPFATGGLYPGVIVEPRGKFLYATGFNSNNVAVFAIDAGTGALTAIAASPFAVGPNPNGPYIDPGGKFAYFADFGAGASSNVSAYGLDAGTGALMPVASSPFAASTGAQTISFSK